MADFTSCNCPCPGRRWEKSGCTITVLCPAHERSTSPKPRRRVELCIVVTSSEADTRLSGEFVAGISWGITALWAAAEICTVYTHLIFLFEILSPKPAIFRAVFKRPHLFAHAHRKHTNSALACNFSITPKTQAPPRVIQNTLSCLPAFLFKASINNSYCALRELSKLKPYYCTFTMPTDSRLCHFKAGLCGLNMSALTTFTLPPAQDVQSAFKTKQQFLV